MSVGGGVPGEAHFDVTRCPRVELADGISAILRDTVRHPRSPGGRVQAAESGQDWDLGWVRDWPQHLIVIHWKDRSTQIGRSTQISEELAREIVTAEDAGGLLMYIVDGLLNA